MRILTVLRSGGDFLPKHVYALQRQCAQFAPLDEFVCLSDMNLPGVTTIPLKYNWKGWYAKMEMFRPDIGGDFLYMDLDTVVVGPLDDILRVNKLTMLRDFYRDGVRRKEGLGSGFMCIPSEGLNSTAVRAPASDRAAMWQSWIADPVTAMQVCGHRGDQFWMERMWLGKAQRWQDVVPGQIVSYKVHCLTNMLGAEPAFSPPPNARLICMHGKPRPWDVPQFKDLY